MNIRDIIERLRLPFRSDEKELRQSLQRIMGFYPCHIEHYKVALTHKSSGQRNTDALVLTEASCLVLRYPKAHMRIVRR